MSHLTSCNFCVLHDMKRRDKKHAYRVVTGKGEWAGWLIVQKRELTGLRSPKYLGEWESAETWFKEISDHCVC